MPTADADLIVAAVRNNAAWCATVCRAHGVASAETDGWWLSCAGAPTYYPDAVSLEADADPALLPVRSPLGVKDSFASLRLEPYGFRVLLEGAWLQLCPAPAVDGWHRVRADELDDWTGAHGDAPAITPEVLDDPEVRVLVADDHSAGVIVSRAAGVVGVSNVFGPPSVWRSLARVAGAVWPGLPLVCWESGRALRDAEAAGHVTLAPMRVWLRE